MPGRTRRAFLQDEQGAWSLFNMFMFMLLAGLGGLALDVTNAYRHKTMLQVTADAAAAAAAMDLPDRSAALAAARAVVEANMPFATYNEVLRANDIVFGAWDRNNRTVDETVAFADSVVLTLSEDRAAGNGVATFMLRAVSISGWTVEARSSATRINALGDCPNAILSRGYVEIAGAQDMAAGCVHGQGRFLLDGRDAVRMQQNNAFDLDRSVVSMPDPDIQFAEAGQNLNVGLPFDSETSVVKSADRRPQLDEQLFCYRVNDAGDYPQGPGAEEAAKATNLSANACRYGAPGSGIWGALSAETPPSALRGSVSWDSAQSPITAWPNGPLEPGRRYVIDGDVVIGQDSAPLGGWVENVTVLATGSITVQDPATRIRNALLFSRYGEVVVADETTLGDDYCATGTGLVYLFGNAVRIASDTALSGVVAAAAHHIELGSTGGLFGTPDRGVSLQAGAKIKLPDDNAYADCAVPLPGLFGSLQTADSILSVPSGEPRSVLVQ
ncbi:MAG: pilus assembly protein TadG-related protein [Pseudomonadota bacterium]